MAETTTTSKKKYKCQKCGKTMSEDKFYTYRNGDKVEFCKACLTMHIDNFDPSTYVWILEKLDIPYVPVEWNILRDRAYAKNPRGMNGMTVFGRYLSKMKLKQFKDYGYADSEMLQQENKKNETYQMEIDPAFEKEMTEKYEAGEISEAQYRTLVSTEIQMTEDQEHPIDPLAEQEEEDKKQAAMSTFYDDSMFMSEEDIPDPGADLTDDDKLYLAMKWGRLYKPNEWIELERKWNEMKESFDIQDSDTEGTLLLICKTFLKMNQAVDAGDMTAYQQLSRVYDTLRKSAKFTAAQNKEKKDNFVDSVGDLVALCEREGFIPRYATDIPQDKVDVTLKDMNDYVYKLVTQDLGFGQQIEDSLKKIQIQKELNETEENGTSDIEDEEFKDYYEDVAMQKAQDEMAILLKDK